MEIRDATEDDLPAITDLYNALIADHDGRVARRPVHPRGAGRARWPAGRRRATRRSSPTTPARWSATRAARRSASDRFPGYRHTAELTVHVRGDRHGQRIGSTLIEALVDRARAIDLHVLVAAVDADNDASIRFHEALGFTAGGPHARGRPQVRPLANPRAPPAHHRLAIVDDRRRHLSVIAAGGRAPPGARRRDGRHRAVDVERASSSARPTTSSCSRPGGCCSPSRCWG